MKKLSQMTLEELWELFPIILEPHREEWKQYYEEEEKQIKDALSNTNTVRISHIGSTSVEKIWAKPIVDILIEIEKTRTWHLPQTA